MKSRTQGMSCHKGECKMCLEGEAAQETGPQAHGSGPGEPELPGASDRKSPSQEGR